MIPLTLFVRAIKNPFKLHATRWETLNGRISPRRLKYPQWAGRLLIMDSKNWPKLILRILAFAIKLNGGRWECQIKTQEYPYYNLENDMP